jgi:tetratricopeptide (TPR) repeat protein
VNRVIWLALALSLGGGAFERVAAEEAKGADAEYKRLLTEDDALMQEVQQQAGNSSWLTQSMLKARLRRLDSGYKSFLQQHPEHVRGMVAYGGFLRDTQRDDEAISWWKKAIALDPRCAVAYNNLGEVLGHDGHAGDALRLHQKAYELDPNDPLFHFNWATTCIVYRKDALDVYGWKEDEIFRHSLDQFRIARDLAPQDFQYSSAYAESFYMMKDPDWHEAYAGWEYCLGQPLQDGERQHVYGQLARVCIHMKQYDAARQWINKMDSADNQSMRKLLERRLAELIASTPKP